MKQEILDLLDHPEEIFENSNEDAREHQLLLTNHEKDNFVIAAAKEHSKKIHFYAVDYAHCFVFSRLDYKFYWAMYYVIGSIIVGAIITGIDQIPFIDGFYTAASAMTGTGLATIGMYQLSKTSFMLMASLMMCGCAPFMSLMLILWRRHGFAKAIAEISRLRDKKSIHSFRKLPDSHKETIREAFLLDEALGILGYFVASYYLLVLLVGGFFLFLALQLRPLPDELIQRGVSYSDNAMFLTVAAFANAGMTITSDNLMCMTNNPCAYLILVVFILAGNSAYPIFLRGFISSVLYVHSKLSGTKLSSYTTVKKSTHTDEEEKKEESAGQKHIETRSARFRRVVQFILDHPHRLTPYLFSNLQTKVLAVLILLLVLLQYIFFLSSTLARHSALRAHDSLTLAGIGFFQTMSTRSAGFAMMDLRELNQGVIFIYVVMMYMSAFPFVATLEKSHAAENLQRKKEEEKAVNEVISPLQAEHATNSNTPDNQKVGISQRSGKFKSQINVVKKEGSDTKDEDKEKSKDTHIHKKFLGAFLLRHSFVLFAAVLVCAYSEDVMLTDPTIDVNLWYIIFEIISAYGNAGLSLGVPGQIYSLSGAMTVTGKLAIIIVMWLGKHRGLASAKDEVVDFQWKHLKSAYLVDEIHSVKENSSSINNIQPECSNIDDQL